MIRFLLVCLVLAVVSPIMFWLWLGYGALWVAYDYEEGQLDES